MRDYDNLRVFKLRPEWIQFECLLMGLLRNVLQKSNAAVEFKSEKCWGELRSRGERLLIPL